MPKPVMVPGATHPEPHFVDLSPLASSEDDDEEIDVDGELLGDYDSIKTEGMSEEYTGQVKNLVKMYETFAKNINDSGDKGMKNGETTTTSKSGKSQKLSNKSNSSSSPASATTKMTASDSLPASAELRISQLESKMGAFVTFVSELVAGEIDILGSNYIHQVNTDKNIDILKTSLKTFDDELDEVHEQLEDVETGVSLLKKDNKRIKMKMKQLEQWIQTGSNDLRGLVADINKNMGDLSNMVERIAGTVERLVTMIPKIKEKVENEETIKSKTAVNEVQVVKQNEVE